MSCKENHEEAKGSADAIHPDRLAGFVQSFREENKMFMEEQKRELLRAVLEVLQNTSSIAPRHFVDALKKSSELETHQQEDGWSPTSPQERSVCACQRDDLSCGHSDAQKPHSGDYHLHGLPSPLNAMVDTMATQVTEQECLLYPHVRAYRSNDGGTPIKNEDRSTSRGADYPRSTSKEEMKKCLGGRIGDTTHSSSSDLVKQSPRSSRLLVSPLNTNVRPTRNAPILRRRIRMPTKNACRDDILTSAEIASEPYSSFICDQSVSKVLEESERLLGISKLKNFDEPDKQIDIRGSKDTRSAVNAILVDPEAHLGFHAPEYSTKNDSSEKFQDWENEIARNILTLYTTTLSTQEKASEISESAAAGSNLPENTSDSGKKFNASQALPAIKNNRSVGRGWLPSRKESKGVIVNAPIIPKPIWFTGGGSVRAVWCGVAGSADSGVETENVSCSHKLCAKLRNLESRANYQQYIVLIEGLLEAHFRGGKFSEAHKRQLRQLAVTCCAFATRLLQDKNHASALDILKKSEVLIEHQGIAMKEQRELTGYVNDTYAYYYYTRKKYSAALQYAQRSLRCHATDLDKTDLANCQSHVAAILSRQGKHAQSIEHLKMAISLFESSAINASQAPAQKLCLVAVCFNNLALECLHLRQIEEACSASQNAQRIWRLCLSYSNRWAHDFQKTHTCALSALSAMKAKVTDGDAAQAKLFKELSASLYS